MVFVQCRDCKHKAGTVDQFDGRGSSDFGGANRLRRRNHCVRAFSLSDRLDPRRLFSGCALVAALATLCLVFIPPTGTLVVSLRFLTGLCMAGVYPVGMRMAATWASGDLGLLIGLLVGALTLGSASPHLLAATVEVVAAYLPRSIRVGVSCGYFDLLRPSGPEHP